MKIFSIFCLISTVVLTGCISTRQTKQMIQLKRFGDNRAEMDRFIQIQEDGFSRLQEDFKGKRLAAGTPKRLIISRYADPVYCKSLEGGFAGEICLYRRPTEFFSSDVIFLYFDKNGDLESWESLTGENTSPDQ
ncbi:MAG: hypothetical protein WC547_00835 [Candidatus Omnitrophota bacterium]